MANTDPVRNLHVLSISDRNKPEGRPNHWVLVNRQEKPEIKDHANQDNKILDATLEIDYQLIVPDHRQISYAGESFCAGYSEAKGISLSSVTPEQRNAIFVPRRLIGCQLGTYLMNELVLWARHWPKAKIHPIELLEGQAYPENKDRRNRFYQKFGFEFDYSDPEHKAGLSRPMLAEALTPVNSWEKISEDIICSISWRSLFMARA